MRIVRCNMRSRRNITGLSCPITKARSTIIELNQFSIVPLLGSMHAAGIRVEDCL
jgi:hypothetical protein